MIEIIDAKKQIIKFKGTEYKVDIQFTGRNFWVLDAETGEKITKWDNKTPLYAVSVNDNGRLASQMFISDKEAKKLYDGYVEYYKKVAEIKDKTIKVKVEIDEHEEECIFTFDTKLYEKVVCLFYHEYFKQELI